MTSNGIHKLSIIHVISVDLAHWALGHDFSKNRGVHVQKADSSFQREIECVPAVGSFMEVQLPSGLVLMGSITGHRMSVTTSKAKLHILSSVILHADKSMTLDEFIQDLAAGGWEPFAGYK